MSDGFERKVRAAAVATPAGLHEGACSRVGDGWAPPNRRLTSRAAPTASMTVDGDERTGEMR